MTNAKRRDIISALSPSREAKREHSSAGRASALQAEGHRFEPYCSHQSVCSFVKFGLVAQLVRALACHARGRGFEPLPGRHFTRQFASVAQLVEQRTENPRVVGSIPTGGTSGNDKIAATIRGFSSFGRARPCQGRGGGFEPRNPLHEKRPFVERRKVFFMSFTCCRGSPRAGSPTARKYSRNVRSARPRFISPYFHRARR